MKALLVSPRSESSYGDPVYPQLGLAYLSAMLTTRGISHDILDLELYPNWKKKIAKELNKKSYDIVGISSTTYTYDKAVNIAKIVRELNPNAKIVLGGPHPSIIGERILRNNPYVDFVIRGDGECALIELINALNGLIDLRDVPNLCYNNGNKICCNDIKLISSLDTLPYPNFEAFELLKYTEAHQKLPILSSRGCPYNCIYCSVGLIMGKGFRSHSPRYIVDEIRYLHEKYKTVFFDLLDDNFTLNLTRAKEICKMLITEQIDISWALPNGIRADRTDNELITLMRQAGCREVGIGIESGRDSILKNLKRGVTIEQIQKCIEHLKESGICVKGFFLIGSPGERKEDVLYSLEFAKKLDLDEVRFGMLTPYPGTELWNWVGENNLWIVENPLDEVIGYNEIGSANSLYETPEFPVDEKKRIYAQICDAINEYETKKLNYKERLKRVLGKSAFMTKSYHKGRYMYRVMKNSCM